MLLKSESLRTGENRIAAAGDPLEDRCESSSARLGGRSKVSHRGRDARISGRSRRCSASESAFQTCQTCQTSHWEPSRFSGGSSFSRNAGVFPRVSMKYVLACENGLSFRSRQPVLTRTYVSKKAFIPRPTRWWNRAVESTSGGCGKLQSRL